MVSPEVCVSAPAVKVNAVFTVTELFQVKVPPGVENVKLFSWLPAPEKGIVPEKVEPPKIKLDVLLLIRPVAEEVIEPPFIVSVNPEKSKLPFVSAIVPETVRLEPNFTVPVLATVKLFRNSVPEANDKLPSAPLPLNVRLEVEDPPMVPLAEAKML